MGLEFREDYAKARERLVRRLELLGYIRSRRVADAIGKVPRELFVPDELKQFAYDDRPLPIGYGQTISAPHMVAIMIEKLDPGERDRVLEIGSGSGYLLAVLAELVVGGMLVGVEIQPELAKRSLDVLKKLKLSDRVYIVVGDGTMFNSGREFFDRIVVSAAASEIPENLVSMLRKGGRMIIPIGSMDMQYLYIVNKDYNGELKIARGDPCLFVPLKGSMDYSVDRDL
jgi:protein-L-isoaspartate(D-aspartate) O-methyltransferase